MSGGAMTAAAFMALAAECAGDMPADAMAARVWTQRLAAHAQVESGLDPAAVSRPNRDGSRDFGLMQVNESWLPRIGLNRQQIMDPCTNIRVGAAILADADRAAACIYNSGRPDCRRQSGTNGYPEKIRAAAARVAAAPEVAAPSPDHPRREACAPSWDVWARCKPETPRRAESPPPAAPIVLSGRLATEIPE